MFTSKKAQYLNGKFEKISPITNIDTLYYEQVLCDSLNNASINFHVERHSVAKCMPIQFNTSNYIENIYKTNINYDDLNKLQPNLNNSPIIFNTNIKKQEINSYRYDSSLYKINSSTYIDLHNILNNYVLIYDFEIKNTQINDYINNLNTSYLNTCILFEDISSRIYNNDIDNTSNNDIYTIQYYDTSIKLQVINQTIDNNQINCSISLDESNASTRWINFHYNENNKLMYLQNINYNEANFDFINVNAIFNYPDDAYNNKFFCNSSNVLICNDKNIKNNEIYNSSYIKLNKECNQNIIINSQGIEISQNCCFNTIINSINSYVFNENFKELNSSIKINGNNNKILNCENCSITIDGDENYIANLKNIQLYINSNNIIIGDESTNIVNSEQIYILNNNKLFLNDSISMAYQNGLLENYVIFGSSTNKIDIYVKSINTIK